MLKLHSEVATEYFIWTDITRGQAVFRETKLTEAKVYYPQGCMVIQDAVLPLVTMVWMVQAINDGTLDANRT